jgi:hypothetical protein
MLIIGEQHGNAPVWNKENQLKSIYFIFKSSWTTYRLLTVQIELLLVTESSDGFVRFGSVRPGTPNAVEA